MIKLTGAITGSFPPSKHVFMIWIKRSGVLTSHLASSSAHSSSIWRSFSFSSSMVLKWNQSLSNLRKQKKVCIFIFVDELWFTSRLHDLPTVTWLSDNTIVSNPIGQVPTPRIMHYFFILLTKMLSKLFLEAFYVLNLKKSQNKVSH